MVGEKGRSSLHLERAGDPKHWNLLGKKKGKEGHFKQKDQRYKFCILFSQK